MSDDLSHPPIATKTEEYEALKPSLSVPEIVVPSSLNSDVVEKPKKSSMALLMILLIAATLGGVGVIFSFITQQSNTTLTTSVPSPTPLSSTTLATINLVTQYENPFDQTTQYSNPFSTEQNPFDNLQ